MHEGQRLAAGEIVEHDDGPVHRGRIGDGLALRVVVGDREMRARPYAGDLVALHCAGVDVGVVAARRVGRADAVAQPWRIDRAPVREVAKGDPHRFDRLGDREQPLGVGIGDDDRHRKAPAGVPTRYRSAIFGITSVRNSSSDRRACANVRLPKNR